MSDSRVSKRRKVEDEEAGGDVRAGQRRGNGGLNPKIRLDYFTMQQMIVALAILMMLFLLISTSGALYAMSFVNNWRVPVLRVSLEAMRQAAGGIYCNSNCWVPWDFATCAPQLFLLAPKHGGISVLHELLKLHPRFIEPLPIGQINVQRDGEALAKILQPVSAYTDGFFASADFDPLLHEYGERELLAHYMSGFEDISPPIPALRSFLVQNLHSITGEISDTYFSDLKAMGRMAALLPHAKVVVMLRDPVRRMYDAFMESAERHLPTNEFDNMRNNGTANRVLEACVDAQLESLNLCGISEWAKKPRIHWVKTGLPCYDQVRDSSGDCGPLNDHCLPAVAKEVCDGRLVLESLYGLYLQALLVSFDMDSVHLLLYEDLLEEPRETLRGLTVFLGVEEFHWDAKAQEVLSSSRDKLDYWPVDKSLRRILYRALADYNATLVKIARKLDVSRWVQ